MEDQRSVCPIFVAPNNRPNVLQPLGSGVLLSLGDETFVLSAAHVVDTLDWGALMLPGVSGFVEFGGNFHRRPMEPGKSRNEDAIDFAFLRLAPETVAELSPEFRPLGWQDLGLFETLGEGDLYTFAGFPASRTKVRRRVVQSELFKYTGGAASDALYQETGFDPELHIAMMFNIARCVVGGEKIQATADPHGVSGGGIFSWPKTVREGPSEAAPRRLVGIAHTYRKRPGCLVGTRINGCVAAILHHYPNLDPTAGQGSRGAIPVGVVWYRESDWPRIRREFEDGHQMHASFNEWREAAQTGIETLLKRGVEAVPVPLAIEEITKYCTETGQPNIGRTRGELASRRVAEAILGRALGDRRSASVGRGCASSFGAAMPRGSWE
ncbi:MAG: hypothetical protein WEF50_10585 [Myxococcota bacterium]